MADDDDRNDRDGRQGSGDRERSDREPVDDGDREDDEGRDDFEEGLEPPPDDGPLRTLPVRRLPLADDAAATAPAPRAWHWVPLAALVTLGTTTCSAFVAAAAMPETQEAVLAFSESVSGAQTDQQRLEAVESLMEGPMAEDVMRVLVAMTIAFAIGVILAGFLATALGRSGILEASLGTCVFVILSFLFVSGGLTPLAIPSAAFAFGLGAIGAWIGTRVRRRRRR